MDIDFRISGLPHSVVKQADNSRVRELVKKIENHPHRQDLQADLQQKNAYNPFSAKSKKMTKDMCNLELFELCETNPIVQCKECLPYWNQGIVYCTCVHLLEESEASQGVTQWTLDLLSIQNYVTEKERPRGHRFGKTKEQINHHIAHNMRKRCIKRNFEGIHDRFLKDPVFRESQLEHDRTEEICIQMGCQQVVGVPVPQVAEQFVARFVAVPVPLILNETVDVVTLNPLLQISERMCEKIGQVFLHKSARSLSHFC